MGCVPLLLLLIALWIFFPGGDALSPDEQIRRPPVSEAPAGGGGEDVIEMPGNLQPEYAVEDPGPPQDSQGTAFAIGTTGLWLTAEHVVNGCDRLGLATGPDTAERVREVYESEVSDAALIADGLPSDFALPLTRAVPETGDAGYHMGFPTGRPAVVQSRFIGRAAAVRGSARGPVTPILAWAEVLRIPDFSHTLGGISGGPTLDAQGAVVGINSASSDRRGRILTTHPLQALNLIRAAGQTPAANAARPIAGPAAATARFQALYRAGAIRHVYCDVVK